MGESGAANGNGSQRAPDAEEGPSERHGNGESETWVLQGDAAARTGFSVSAIRKWRRMGVVAERKVTSGAGMERVEVRLEDVLARASLQPERRGDHAPAEMPQARTVVIRIEDLEDLFQRMVGAEQRAERAEADLESLRAQSRFTFGQMAELRRQLQACAGRTTGPGAVDRVDVRPPAPPVPPVRVLRDTAVRADQERRGPPSRPSPDRETATSMSGGHGEQAQNSHPEELAERLRRIYARLDEYRRQAVISPAAEQQRQRALAEYDRVLMALCTALEMPTGLAEGQPVGVDTRAALTRALARAGLDVRAGVRQPPPAARARRVAGGRRPGGGEHR